MIDAESFLAPSQSLSTSPWQVSNVATSELTPAQLALMESLGAEPVTVNGPYGPTLRFIPPRALSTLSISPRSTGIVPAIEEAPIVATEHHDAIDATVEATGAVLPPYLFVSTAPSARAFALDSPTNGIAADIESKLLLIDDVLAGLSTARDELVDDTPTTAPFEEEQDSDELALATVFDEEIDWRLGF